LLAPDRALDGWPAVIAGEALGQRIRNGSIFSVPASNDSAAVRAYDDAGRLLALASPIAPGDSGEYLLHPDKVFGAAGIH
jgi:hypothetical protein